ncbi:MAG: transglutaminase-like domain-containing protein [Candidatus Latescibacterota bacterium]
MAEREAAVDLTPQRGPAALGPAYRYMLEHDAHAPGAVDRGLLAEMVRIGPATVEVLYAGCPPEPVRYAPGSRPVLEGIVGEAIGAAKPPEERTRRLAVWTARFYRGAPAVSLDAVVLGGTEEEVIARGSDWCTDVARVACVLAQVAGMPARLVYLFDLDQAYSGHAIVEVWRDGGWGAVDACTGVVYREDGRPASTWSLMRAPDLVAAHRAACPGALYTTAAQFRAAAVANYAIWEARQYEYPVSGLNAYYRSILSMADQGWPGGLRWLHGEDRL